MNYVRSIRVYPMTPDFSTMKFKEIHLKKKISNGERTMYKQWKKLYIYRHFHHNTHQYSNVCTFKKS